MYHANNQKQNSLLLQKKQKCFKITAQYGLIQVYWLVWDSTSDHMETAGYIF